VACHPLHERRVLRDRPFFVETPCTSCRKRQRLPAPRDDHGNAKPSLRLTIRWMERPFLSRMRSAHSRVDPYQMVTLPRSLCNVDWMRRPLTYEKVYPYPHFYPKLIDAAHTSGFWGSVLRCRSLAGTGYRQRSFDWLVRYWFYSICFIFHRMQKMVK